MGNEKNVALSVKAALTASIIAGIGASVPAPAFAQAPEAAASEDIVVTARRRAENLQDVPLAVSAFREEDMARFQTEDLVELGGKVPNLFIKQNPTTTVSTSLYIRGVGQDESHFTSENGVGVYIDGVFYPRASGSLIQLLDYESIEILRGPQGTLFGKNAPAGAISLKSRRPNAEAFSVRGSAGLGGDNLIEGGVFVNIPLSSTLSMKLDFASRTQDGYVFDNVGGQDVNGVDKQAFRAALRWTPSEDLDLQLTLDRSADNSQPYAPVFVVGRTPQYDVYQTYIDPAFNRNQNFEGNGVTLAADWSVNDTLSLKSITSYRWFEHDLWGELLGIPGVPIALFRGQEQYQYSQEFQANIETEKFSLVGGVLYFFENNQEQAFNQFTGAGSGSLYPISDQDSESIAAYVEGTYRFTDWVSFTLGGRYGQDEKTMTRRSTNLPGGAGPVVAYDVSELSKDWNEFTPRAILDFRPFEAFGVETTNDLLAYVSYSKGYKAGAFDPTFTGDQDQAEFIYDPEHVTTTEVGLKSEWLDRRLTVNFAYYQNKYEDFQIADCTFGPSSVCVPATFDVDIDGYEVEVTAQPTPSLFLFASFATINDEIKSPAYAGRDLENTPDYTYFLSGEYTAALPNAYEGVFGVNYQYTDNYFHDLQNGVEAETDAYGLLGAYIGVGPDSGKWQVRVYGENLADEEYIVNALSGGSWWMGRPQTLGVRLNFEM